MQGLLKAWLILSLVSLARAFSGVYFDNGMGQTAIEYLDMTDQETMREEILTLLGLTHAPERSTPRLISNNSNHTVSYKGLIYSPDVSAYFNKMKSWNYSFYSSTDENDPKNSIFDLNKSFFIGNLSLNSF